MLVLTGLLSAASGAVAQSLTESITWKDASGVVYHGRADQGYLTVDGVTYPVCQAIGTSQTGNNPVAMGTSTDNKVYLTGDFSFPAIVANPKENGKKYVLACISDGILQGCPDLKSVFIPKTVYMLKDHIAREANSFTNITFEEGSTLGRIGSSAFLGDGALETFAMPGSTEVVGSACFAGCASLDYLILSGNANTQIQNGAFSGCNSLKNVLCVGDLPTNIDYGNQELLNANIYVPDAGTANAGSFTQVKSIISSLTTTYGQDPKGTAAFGDTWNGEEVTVKCKFQNGRLPAGCYPPGQEVVNVTLSGELNNTFSYKPGFFIDPAEATIKLKALPNVVYGTKNGAQIDEAVRNIGFEYSGFLAGDEKTIDRSKITFELYKDQACKQKAKKNEAGNYDAGVYYVKASSEKLKFEDCNGKKVGKEYSACSGQNYLVTFLGNGNGNDGGMIEIVPGDDPWGQDGSGWKQGDITVKVGDVESFVAAVTKNGATVNYSVENTNIATRVANALQVKGVHVGTTKLVATATAAPNYKAPAPLKVNVKVVKKDSDLTDPAEGSVEVTGTECYTIQGPTSATEELTYEVTNETSRETVNGVTTIHTETLTVAIAPDGKLTVCGIKSGSEVITVKTPGDEDTEPGEKEIPAVVKDPTRKDFLSDEGNIFEWCVGEIEGKVLETSDFCKPRFKCAFVQEGHTTPYADVKLYLEVTPEKAENDPYATVTGYTKGDMSYFGDRYEKGNDEGKLYCEHATNGALVQLKLTLKDEGSAPIYNDMVLLRQVKIVKKDPTDPTAGNNDWANGDPVAETTVDVEKPLPNPTGDGNPDCAQKAEYTGAETLNLKKDPATCGWTVTPSEAGEEKVTVTIPGDDDTEDLTKTIIVKTTLNKRNVAWDVTASSVKVDENKNVTGATWYDGRKTDKTPQIVEAKYYSIVGEDYLAFVGTQENPSPDVPNMNGGNFGTVGLAVNGGNTTGVKLFIPADREFEEVDLTKPFTVTKKNVSVIGEDGKPFDTSKKLTALGEVGQTVPLLPKVYAPEGYELVFEMDAAFKDHANLLNFGDGDAQAELLLPTAAKTPATGKCYVKGDEKTNDSAPITIELTINKRTGDVAWTAADPTEGVIDNEYLLPLPTSTYNPTLEGFDASKIEIEPAMVYDAATGTYIKSPEAAAHVVSVTKTGDEPGILIEMDNAGDAVMTITIPGNTMMEDATKSIKLLIRNRAAKLVWPVEDTYEAMVEERKELPFPTSKDATITVDDIRVIGPGTIEKVGDKLVVTPTDAGDVHIIVTVPGNANYTSTTKDITIVATKQPANLVWDADASNGKVGEKRELPWATTTDLSTDGQTPTEIKDLDAYEVGDDSLAKLYVDETTGKLMVEFLEEGDVILTVYKEGNNKYEDKDSSVEIHVEGHAALGVIGSASEVSISNEPGYLVISGAQSHVTVYDRAGRVVYAGGNARVRIEQGLYIVVCGGQATKLLAK